MFRKDRLKGTVISLILPILLLLLWYYIAGRLNKPTVLPTISTVIDNFLNAMDNFIGLGSIPKNVLFSLIRVGIGYSLGVIVAVPLGLLMGYFKTVRNLCENFINLFKPIPPIAWQPLVLGWFGVRSLATLFHLSYGPDFATWDHFKLSMIFLIALGSFFPVVGNVAFGVRNVRKTLIESAKVLGASEKDIFFRVLLPGAAPNIMNGLRMGLAASWGCLVSAEMLPGSISGVGYLITHAYELARVDLVITGMICIGVVGAFLDGIFKLIAERCFSWEYKTK